MPAGRSNEHFLIGTGVQPEPAEEHVCSDCGYTHTRRKNFKKSGEGLTCSTEHYTDKDGNLKRARNPYAKG